MACSPKPDNKPIVTVKTKGAKRRMPAPVVMDMSINRSWKKGRGLLIPHTAFIPFLILPNTVVDIHNKPMIPTMPVMGLLLEIISNCSAAASFETGTKEVITVTIRVPCRSVPLAKYPRIALIARVNGSKENRK